MKICFIHPWVKDIKSFLHVTCLDGSISPDSLEWSDDNPDILFASEWIYYRKDCYKKFKELYNKAGIAVGYFGEAIEPDWNIFDYGVGFSNRHSGDDRFIRILSPGDMYSNFIKHSVNEISTADDAKALLQTKNGFCNFLYSNPKAHPMRDNLFHEISKYKKVDSLGKHLNNVSIPGTGYGNGHAADCVSIKAGYKFSISSENACFYGYTSEKCFTSLEAHTVPIYWGNPDICQDINSKAIINVMEYASIDEVINRIREIDSNDDLWAEIVSQPWRTADQVNDQRRRTEEYRAGMVSLLSGNFKEYAPRGFHPDLYKEHFLTGKFVFERSFKEKLVQKASLLLKKK